MGLDWCFLIVGGVVVGFLVVFNVLIVSMLFVLEEVYYNFLLIIWIIVLVSVMVSNFILFNFFGFVLVLYILYGYNFLLS